MKLKTPLAVVLFAGLCFSASEAEAGSVFLFSAASHEQIFEDIDARDADNTVVRDAKSVLALRELFVVTLYQMLMVRTAGAAEAVERLVKRPLTDFSSLGKHMSGRFLAAKTAVGFISEKVRGVASVLAAVFMSLVVVRAFFFEKYGQPPVLCQTSQILRC